MLTRRILRASSAQSSPTLVLRTFTSTSRVQRTPALADITPNGASAFDTKQAEFRERVREAQRAKEKQDSQSTVNSSTTQSASAAGTSLRGNAKETGSSGRDSGGIPASSDDSVVETLALGSLSTHNPGEARDAQAAQENTRRKSKLSSLIYGTHEGQQMDQEIERSFSQVLARGKYVHSIVFHTVKPDRVDEYVDLVGGWYPRVAGNKDNHVHLVGSWRTEVGDCDTFGMHRGSMADKMAVEYTD